MSDIERMLNFLEERFGIKRDVFKDCEFHEAGDIWITTREAINVPLRTYIRKGIRLVRIFKNGEMKFTTDGIQIFGKYATKNVIYLTKEETIDYSMGKDIDLPILFPSISDGQVILRFINYNLGSGLLRGRRIKNQLPKGKRLEIVFGKVKKRGIIFDLDGTIVDTEHLHHEATNRVLERFGLRVDDDLAVKLRGLDDRFFFNSIINNMGLKGDLLEDLIQFKKEIYLKIIEKEEIQILPGIREILDEIKALGVKVGIASSSSKLEIHKILQKTSLIHYFHQITSGEEVDKGKPYPYIFFKACEKLKLNPLECICFEDSFSGIQASKRAGLFTISLKSNFGSEYADLRVNSYFDLKMEELIK